MDTSIGYVIVGSIVMVMVWQAIANLNQGRRKPSSLLNSFKMEDIEVEDTLPPSRTNPQQSLVAPRVEYSPDLAPFPIPGQTNISDNREIMKKEISELEEVNIERYSVLERTSEKIAECQNTIELIQGLSEEYNIAVNQDLLEAPLEGATLAELELRQSSLLELYDKLYQLSFENTIQDIRKREITLQENQEEQVKAIVDAEMDELSHQLLHLRREEELYREIRGAQTVGYLESLDFSELDEEA